MDTKRTYSVFLKTTLTMNKQTFDSKGKTVVVNNEVPNWQVDLVKKRYEDYLKNPDQIFDFYEALMDIEKDLTSG